MADKFQQLIEKGKKVSPAVAQAMADGSVSTATKPELSDALTRLLVQGEISPISNAGATADTNPWQTYLDSLQALSQCSYENKESCLLMLQRKLIPLLTQIIQTEKAYVFLAKKNGWIDLANYFKHELFALKKDLSSLPHRKMLRSLFDHFQTKRRLFLLFQKTEQICYDRRSQYTDTVFVTVLNDLLGHMTTFGDKYLKKDLVFFASIEETAKTLLMKQPVQKIAAPAVDARDEAAAEELRRLFPKLLIKLHRLKEKSAQAVPVPAL